jgi:small subunit ribosomal protein S1
MESLLDSESLDFRSLRRGDVVEGQVMGVDRDGVLVDVGSKSEGIIPPNEMHSLGAEGASRLQAGDKILVYVLQPESAEGQILLSLDRARGERGWRVLQQRFEDAESFEAEVSGYNKGGLLVNVEGVNAFVPLSQLVGIRPERSDEDPEGSLAQAVGKKLRVKVIEINRRRNRVILSERAALQEWRSQQKDRLLSELREGEIRRGRITSVRSFGVFIDLGGADGLAHLSELSWDRNRSPEELYHIGDEVDAFVMKVDPETKKIALSLRRAQPERWEGIVDRYQIGEMVAGRVTKLVTFGAFARIDGPVEGLIHVSELVDRRINHPREVVKEGDILPLRIVRIERDRHRLGLSLRAARDEAERQGWEFSDDGSVTYVPDEIRREVEARTGGPSLPDSGGSDAGDHEPQDEAAVASLPRNGSSDSSDEPEPASASQAQGTERQFD